MDFLIISIGGKVTKPCEAYGNHGFLGFVMFTGTQDLVQYGPPRQKNIATLSKANILATLKATMTQLWLKLGELVSIQKIFGWNAVIPWLDQEQCRKK